MVWITRSASSKLVSHTRWPCRVTFFFNPRNVIHVYLFCLQLSLYIIYPIEHNHDCASFFINNVAR